MARAPILLAARRAIPAVFASLAGTAAAEVVLHEATETIQGVFCVRELTTERPAEDTIAGIVDSFESTPEFEWLGDVAPADFGIAFGLHITLPPSAAGAVRFEVTHPPMGPEGVTVESWTSLVTANTRRYVGFHFEKPYEQVPGPWIMRAYSDGRLLYEATWTILPPGSMPEVTGLCSGPDTLS